MEPLAHTTHCQLEADLGGSELEDKTPFMTVEEQLLPIWEMEKITSERRQCQLIIWAKVIVVNYIEKFQKYIMVATAGWLAKMYVGRRNAKRTSTPMSFKSKLPSSTLRLLLDAGWNEVFIIPRGFLEDSSGILTIPEDFQDWVLAVAPAKCSVLECHIPED